MMKKKVNAKKILTYVLAGALAVFVLVLTWIPLVFDVANLDWDKWLTNSLINTGIMISAIVLGEIFGDEKQKEKVEGLFQRALLAYNRMLDKLTNELEIIVYFSQFFNWFKDRELKIKKEGYLVDNGFDQQFAHQIIKYIGREDIERMKRENIIKIDEKTQKEVKFRRIYDDEYEILTHIYCTNFTIDAPNYTYYLSAFGDSSSKSLLEQAKKIERKEKFNKIFNRTFKVVLSLFISIIWGMATVKELTEGGAKEALINTVTRFIALVGGLLSGYMTSVMAVKLASQKLENKTQVLSFMEIYYNKKDFVPKTYDEIVEEQIQEYERERAKIIIPEIVEEKNDDPLMLENKE